MLNYQRMIPVTGLSTDEALAFPLDRLDRCQDLAREIAEGAKVIDAALAAYEAELKRLFSAAPPARRRT